ncbi:relaxase/mobilization nuclease domain-containing protein [Aquabacterium sp. OR-4]|uniref:relaxase/mobilization nuclease domain-containing protein n=1 Tax=Aquabacterium sp. OR-4 TaxID=2978127 RepID=UPI0028CA60FE|nr:hypothetical protein [Aquabacterium sp. OR-4]MDT7837482.1 hypothetical protein [Aquabacterium sp. OR-4]
MLLKIINHRRKQPRRRADLRRLFRYLFSPQHSMSGKDVRLLGPPQLYKLALTAMPWGDEVADAAAQLTLQMDRYCRAAKAGAQIPPVWYVHIVISFAPAAARMLREPQDPHRHVPQWASSAQNAYRLARDALDFFGWTPNRPTVMVAHGDKRHIHVHVVAVIPVLNDDDWNVLKNSRKQLHEVAMLCAGAYGIPLAGRAAHAHHRKWGHLVDVRPGASRGS